MAIDEEPLARGIRLFELGDLASAEACFRLAAAGPERATALFQLGRLCLQAGRAVEAAACFASVPPKQAPPGLAFLYGESLLAQGRHAEAEQAFEVAARHEPRRAEASLMIGHARLAQERLPAAIRAFEEALVKEQTHLAARYYLAETLIRTGEIVRATSQIHYVLQLKPHYAPALLLRGDIAFHHGDFRQAIVEYTRAIAREAVGAPIYHRLGEAYRAIGDAAQALQAYEAAIRVDAAHWPAFFEAARLCETPKGMLKARRYYRALAYAPSHRVQAAEGLARVEAYMASLDLSAPGQPGVPPADATAGPATFRAPPTLTRSEAPPAPATPAPPAPGPRPGSSALLAPGPRPIGTAPGTRPLSLLDETRSLPRPGTSPLSSTTLRLDRSRSPGTRPLKLPPDPGQAPLPGSEGDPAP